MSNDFFSKMFGTQEKAPEEKESKVKKLTPFDFVNILFTKSNKPIDAVIQSQYDQFMVNRIIACYKDFKTKKFTFLLMINSLDGKKMSNLEHFYCLFYKLPKLDKVYPSYLWNKKDEDVVDKNKLISALKWKFKYNDLGAEYAINVISEQEKLFFLKEYEKRMDFLGKEVK